ncbi:tetrahydromethanopterin S-methyltransferase subunit F [Rhodococcus ruber]|uniref:hypothetical protein n=1 Tax=Rhodococcus ruber TaxID=1830 RepID=UPI001AE65F2D|nr:hypothetical protein [Rhodococcus ruber]MBP2211062.1 tetrahydromethanopterin S-methyltransferase subunit F [Rhodococcus ruber]
MDLETCAVRGWSIITSAGTNSALAGLLAGFVFTAVVIYFNQTGSQRGHEEVRTIALFTASLMTLGLDSYLFSLVSGATPKALGDESHFSEVCGRVWNQAIIASGMLTVGAAALVAGIASLFLSKELSIESEGKADLRKWLFRLVTAVLLGEIMLLGLAAVNYLEVAFNGNVDKRWTTAAWACMLLAMYLTYRLARWKDRMEPGVVSQRWLTVPIGIMVSYLFICPVMVLTASMIPLEWMTSPKGWITALFLVGGVAFPMAVVALIAGALPPRHGTGSEGGDSGETGSGSAESPIAGH